MYTLKYSSTNSSPQHQIDVSAELYFSSILLMQEEPLVPIDWEIGWVSEMVWTLRRKEKLIVLTMKKSNTNCPYIELNQDSLVV